MKSVLVIGSGGRCHAIAEKLNCSPKIDRVYAAPGNAGIASCAECVDIDATDIERLIDFAKAKNIALTVVGPELPLSMGIADRFREAGLRIFGPSAAAARIETSKSFAKDLMQRYNIPTAASRRFNSYEEACIYVAAQPLPIVIKYDGLAAGKGVVVAHERGEAEETLRVMLCERKFGTEGVIIEEFLEGMEFTMMCLVNGGMVAPMELAQDYKRAYDGDKGPNTGGMGACSPVPFVSKEEYDFAAKDIMQRAANAMVAEGCPFCGTLYGGLIKTKDGIKVIEFNARFGDPETQVVLSRLCGDFYEILDDVMENRRPAFEWTERAAAGVVLAAKGYPESYRKGVKIGGVERVDAKVFHMGTKVANGELQTNGGRVLTAVALDSTLEQARDRVLAQIENIECSDLFYRKDIGHWLI